MKRLKYGIIGARDDFGQPFNPVGIIAMDEKRFYVSCKPGHELFVRSFLNYNTSKHVGVPLKFSEKAKAPPEAYYAHMKEENIAMHSLSELVSENAADAEALLQAKMREHVQKE
jgi:hypothetical protein